MEIKIENIVKNLFDSLPFAKYIVLNPTLNTQNELIWLNQWQFIGFEYEPDYAISNGWWKWVEDKTQPDTKSGVFFLTLLSNDLTYNGNRLQTSKYEFQDVGTLCWHKKEDGTIENIVKERTDLDDIDKCKKNFKQEIENKNNTTPEDIANAIIPHIEHFSLEK